jgi:hypothetical protein
MLMICCIFSAVPLIRIVIKEWNNQHHEQHQHQHDLPSKYESEHYLSEQLLPDSNDDIPLRSSISRTRVHTINNINRDTDTDTDTTAGL